MSIIRPLEAADLPAVAAMFQTELRHTAEPATPALRAYLGELYLTGPFADPETPALVYADEDGTVRGFLGVTSQPMVRDGAPLRVAVSGALMVRGHEADPMAGARLLKAFLSGPQDVSLSETAGDAAFTMWRQLRGEALSRHSLDWVRVLRPAGFAVETMARRVPLAGILGPPGRLFDRMRTKRLPARPLRWSSLPDAFRPQGGLTAEEVGPDEFVACLREASDRYPIRRDWTKAQLETIMADIARKPDYGTLRLCHVRTRGGGVLGGFAYYVRPNATGRVLDVIGAPERVGPVLDCLMRDAADHGLVALRGRTTPVVFDALLERRCLMFHHSASVIHARDPALVAAFKAGEAPFNGLVGERWSRLIGDHFG